VKTLIATATTPSDQLRLAAYYRAEATRLRKRSKERQDEGMKRQDTQIASSLSQRVDGSNTARTSHTALPRLPMKLKRLQQHIRKWPNRPNERLAN
jgi:hypothetical protein